MKQIKLGETLRELRKDMKLKTVALADLLGINQSAFSNYETGKVMPKLEAIVKLADFFDVNLDYLVFGEKSEPEEKPEQEKLPIEKRSKNIKASEKVEYLKMAMTLLKINLTDTEISQVIAAYEQVAVKGSAFDIRDAINIKNGVNGYV